MFHIGRMSTVDLEEEAITAEEVKLTIFTSEMQNITHSVSKLFITVSEYAGRRY